MSNRLPSFALAAVLLGTAGLALFHPGCSAPAPEATTAPAASALTALPSMDDRPLPPGHPAIAAPTATRGVMPATNDAPAITWKVPAAWSAVASPSAMRIATYRVPRAPGDTDDVDVSVTRAGGTTDENIERWLGQFDDRGKEDRVVRTVHGLTTTTTAVSGTFQGGGMMTGPSKAHPGWALRGAIIETNGAPYFVKMTGPAASVKAARADFDALVASVNPV